MIRSLDSTTHILNICSKHYEYFFNLPHVIGVAFGYKIVDNNITSEPCIQVLVDKKIPRLSLISNNVVPPFFMGIPTDVFETGIIEAYSNLKASYPFLCGSSISPFMKGSSGTIGAIVKAINEDIYYILSNNHVLARENKAAIGTPIICPSIADGGLYPNDEIATLSRFIPIHFMNDGASPLNIVDCAIAEIKDINMISPCINQIGFPKGVAHPNIGETVIKSGRITGLTEGTILSIGGTIKVKYALSDKRALYTNQILTTPMSSKGDSGSLLLNKNKKAIGLLFSGSRKVSLFNNIANVLSFLNVKLVTKFAL